MSGFVSINMLNDTATSPHILRREVMLPGGLTKISRYTTGILTTSGWTPLDNGLGRVIRKEADDPDMEELFRCHEEERVSSTATPGFVSDNESECDDDHLEATAATVLDTNPDCDSYFRYARWNNPASTDQRKKVLPTMPAVIVDRDIVKQQDGDSFGGIGATEFRAADSQLDRTATAEPSLERNIVGDEDRNINDEYAPPKQGKQVKAFFHPEEDAWLDLFHQKVKTAGEAGAEIKIPGVLDILPGLNVFFEGRVLKDERGKDLPARPAREEKSMKNKIMKMHTKIWHLRDETRKLLLGKQGGTVFVPEVTAEELKQFLNRPS